MIVSAKHSSLLQHSVSDIEKKFNKKQLQGPMLYNFLRL